MSQTLAIVTTPDAATAAARVLLHSVSRGDFEEDFEDIAATVSARLSAAAENANNNFEASATVTLDLDTLGDFDEILAVLESDRNAEYGLLARFIKDGNTALGEANAATGSER